MRLRSEACPQADMIVGNCEEGKGRTKGMLLLLESSDLVE